MTEQFNFREFLLSNGFSYTNTGERQFFQIKKEGKELQHDFTDMAVAKSPTTKSEATKWLNDFLGVKTADKKEPASADPQSASETIAPEIKPAAKSKAKPQVRK